MRELEFSLIFFSFLIKVKRFLSAYTNADHASSTKALYNEALLISQYIIIQFLGVYLLY